MGMLPLVASGLMKNSVAHACDLLARFTVGFMFATSGWGKIKNLDNFVSDFSQWRIPAADVAAPFTAWTELIAGTLLIVGLLTRIAAIFLSFAMLGALVTVVAPPIIAEAATVVDIGSNLFYTPEWLLLLVLIPFALFGARPWSADHMVANYSRKLLSKS